MCVCMGYAIQYAYVNKLSYAWMETKNQNPSGLFALKEIERRKKNDE